LIHNEVINAGKGSGTEIINRGGTEHLQTGYPIVYTSADSVFQIATHEERIPLSTLYYWAALARSLVNDQPALGRVIARPFLGDAGIGFFRTPHRKDFPYKTGKIPLFEELSKQSVALSGNRIIQDLFPYTQIDPVPGQHIADTMEQLHILLQERNHQNDTSRLCIVDLEDFDMVYGHRRDPKGYISALVEFDRYLNQCLSLLQPQDLCLLTADHGNDPTFTLHTDHTRENVPLVSMPAQPSYQGIYPMGMVSSIIRSHFSLS
jgi:phosphopentomutase